MNRSRGLLAFVLATSALASAGYFTWWALTAQVYYSGETILQANQEASVRVSIAIPFLVTSLTWILLHVACRWNVSWAKTAGVALALLLWAFSVVTGFSIGRAVMPGAALLIAAAALTPVTPGPKLRV